MAKKIISDIIVNKKVVKTIEVNDIEELKNAIKQYAAETKIDFWKVSARKHREDYWARQREDFDSLVA